MSENQTAGLFIEKLESDFFQKIIESNEDLRLKHGLKIEEIIIDFSVHVNASRSSEACSGSVQIKTSRAI